MKFFKPDDFNTTGSTLYADMKYASESANLANAKLEKEGQVVYGSNPNNTVWDRFNNKFDSTHKALLINIEKIESECKHESGGIATVKNGKVIHVKCCNFGDYLQWE
jgi:hypothetical protein